MQIARNKWLILANKENQTILPYLYQEKLSVEEFINKDPRQLLLNEDKQKQEEEAKQYTMQALQSDFYLKNSDFKEGEFTCYKCRGKKILTYQKQMRSADEPMTTFFNCVTCGNRWKM